MAKVRVGGIKQLQSFERRREWRDVTRDKLTVGIGFHTRTLPALPPLVSVYPTICSEAVCPHMAYQIVVGGQTAPQTVVCPVLGTITKKSIGEIPIPPNTGKYWPIPNTPIPVSFEPYLRKLQWIQNMEDGHVVFVVKVFLAERS